MSLGNVLALDNKSEESTARLNLTSIGRGFLELSRYFPSRRRSRIDKGFMLVLASVTIVVTLYKS